MEADPEICLQLGSENVVCFREKLPNWGLTWREKLGFVWEREKWAVKISSKSQEIEGAAEINLRIPSGSNGARHH